MTGQPMDARPGRTAVAATVEETEAMLRDWVRSVDPKADVSPGPPGAERKGHGVSLYLLDVAPRPPARGAVRPPLQLWLRYLVSAWADEPGMANRLVIDLAFAAMGRGDDFEMEAEPPAAATWMALDAIPRPAFVLRVAVRRERPELAAKPVLVPLVVEGGDLGVVAGVVLDPREQPIVGAVISIPRLDKEARTDRRGRFQLRGVPGPPVPTRLRVRAKGREIEVAVPDDRDLARSMVIHIDPLEREHG